MTRARNTPDGWRWKSIRALGGGSPTTVQTGPFGAQLHASDYVEDGVPLLLIRNLKDGRLDLSGIPQISEVDASRLARYRLQAGDIVFSRVGRVGSCFLAQHEHAGWLISGQLLRVRLSANAIERQYLFRALTGRYAQDHIAGASVGTTRTSINTQILESLDLLVPDDQREQSKIAEVLSTVDRVIEQTEALIAKQQRIKTGLMQDLLTRGIDEHGNLRSELTHEFKDSPLGRIPVEWECDRLGLHLTAIEQGWSPDCDGDPAPAGCWGVLKTTAVVWDGYQDFENKLLPAWLEPRPRFEVQPKDVLMTRGGPNSRVGVVAYVKATQQQLMLSDKLYRLRYKPSVDPEFLAMMLASNWTQRHLSTLKTGLAESQTNISQAIVKDLLIRVPLPGEQEQIASVVCELDTQLMQLRCCLEKLRAVKIGLVQDLLTGDKRVTPLLDQEGAAA